MDRSLSLPRIKPPFNALSIESKLKRAVPTRLHRSSIAPEDIAHWKHKMVVIVVIVDEQVI